MLHTWIRSRRENAGLTQLVLAGKLGLTQAHVSRLELGHTITSIEMLQRLSVVIGFDLEDAVRQKVTIDSPELGPSQFTRKPTTTPGDS